MAGFLHTRARHSLPSSAAGQRCGYQNQPNPTQPHSSSEAQSFLPYQRKNDNEMLDIHLFFPCNLASPGLRLHTVAGQRSKAPINPKMFVRHHDGTCPTGHGHFMATPSLNMYCQTETMRCELYPVPPLLSCSALLWPVPLVPLWHPPTAITLRAACPSPSSNIHMHCFLPEYPHIKEPRTSFPPPLPSANSLTLTATATASRSHSPPHSHSC